jgi:hypothetical protein
MNELIKQLAEQAGFKYIKDEGIGWSGNYNASLPKFAELIVQECAQEFDNTYMSGGKTMGAYIREKFGVEE